MGGAISQLLEAKLTTSPIFMTSRWPYEGHDHFSETPGQQGIKKEPGWPTPALGSCVSVGYPEAAEDCWTFWVQVAVSVGLKENVLPPSPRSPELPEY
jgi:hypothetical protein